jgi:hypothetical protein
MRTLLSFALTAAVAAMAGCGSSSSTGDGSTWGGGASSGTDATSSTGTQGADAPGTIAGTFTTDGVFLRTLHAGANVLLELDSGVERLGAGNSTTPTVSGILPAVDGSGLLYVDKTSGGSARVCRATLPEGKLDMAFGDKGCTPLPVNDLASPIGLRLLPGGGSITVLNPECSNGCPAEQDGFMLVRLDAKGAVVTSFGVAGVAFPHVAKNAQAVSLGMQSSGALVVNSFNAGFALSLVRIKTEDGTLDTTFGTAGFAISPGASGAMVILPNDGIILGGTYNGVYDIEGWTKNGVADSSFAAGGRLELSSLRNPPDQTNENLESLYADAAGRIYLAAEAVTVSQNGLVWKSPFIARLAKDGTVDASFGTAGIVSSFGATPMDDLATGIGEDASGHILFGLRNQQLGGHGHVVVLVP